MKIIFALNKKMFVEINLYIIYFFFQLSFFWDSKIVNCVKKKR